MSNSYSSGAITSLPINFFENPSLFNQVIDLDTFMEGQSWSPESWKSQLTSSRNFHLLAYFEKRESSEKMSAFALFELQESMGFCHLIKVVTHQDDQNRGIAGKLLQHSINIFSANSSLEKMILEVKTDNLPALKLYESLSFHHLHTAKKFYSDGADAFVMERVL